jgi:hypothetical protein
LAANLNESIEVESERPCKHRKMDTGILDTLALSLEQQVVSVQNVIKVLSSYRPDWLESVPQSMIQVGKLNHIIDGKQLSPNPLGIQQNNEMPHQPRDKVPFVDPTQLNSDTDLSDEDQLPLLDQPDIKMPDSVKSDTDLLLGFKENGLIDDQPSKTLNGEDGKNVEDTLPIGKPDDMCDIEVICINEFQSPTLKSEGLNDKDEDRLPLGKPNDRDVVEIVIKNFKSKVVVRLEY